MLRIAFKRTLYRCQRDWKCSVVYASLRWCSHDSKETCNRVNELGIQMLSSSIHGQIFKQPPVIMSTEKKEEIKNHLTQHDLWNRPTTRVDDVSLNLPTLKGENIDEHFRVLAEEINGPYIQLAEALCKSKLPERPKEWARQPGWTKYDPTTGPTPVNYPTCDAMVFDVEVLVPEGQFPTMATAVSPEYWYSWCSSRVDDKVHYTQTKVRLSDLINFEKSDLRARDTNLDKHSLIIGHNVGFDRSFIKEQYYINNTQTKFLDTMSMHIAVSGLTSMQRVLFMTNKRDDKGFGRKEVREHYKHQRNQRHAPNLAWLAESSLNNLHDVHRLYCPEQPRLHKETRNIFVKGTMGDVRDRFQELMDYCAADVVATHSVFKSVWVEFCERFSHPATLAGMLEMSTAYLPINDKWQKYIHSANQQYNRLEREMQTTFMALADDALKYAQNEQHKQDLWMWDLNWKPKNVNVDPSFNPEESPEERTRKVETIIKKQFPTWYAELCPTKTEYSERLPPGRPAKISTQRRTTPKLLRLTWKGYPLHHHKKYKWGYLVPEQALIYETEKEIYLWLERVNENLLNQDNDPEDNPYKDFPLKEFFEYYCKNRVNSQAMEVKTVVHLERKLASVGKDIERCIDDDSLIPLMREWHTLKQRIDTASRVKPMKTYDRPDEDGSRDIGIPGVRFFCLPHKDGPTKAVGNALSKDFLPRIEDGTLKCCSTSNVNEVLQNSSVMSYWKMSHKRIEEQLKVWFEEQHLPDGVVSSSEYAKDSCIGAIIPRVITAGTVTRRAVEATWLTASNAYEDRVGSELKAFVQSPPGYCFVGADVDSQELWIAAIIGDAKFGGIHGCTAFGWMTLQGNKKDGTDLHSKTASLMGITRDQAKVCNYGRIYGAGANFAQQLLKQFNQNISTDEAAKRTRALYAVTKGKRNRNYKSQTNAVAGACWYGGSESAMFNQLERIAHSEEPRTPALGARISKSLEPHNVSSDFITSRVNWVVQSSGVDYLHLMLVCMKWLFKEYGIEGRFSISIHDEVRYLVHKDDRYRAALALQITNLYTRSLFAYKLGMNDLPQSVAFFSAVDVDTCLRKEVVMDCVTPSNPLGLKEGYGIEAGEALSIYDILCRTQGSLRKGDTVEERNARKETCKTEITVETESPA